LNKRSGISLRSFSKKTKLVIGIDVGGTNLKFGVVNERGEVLKEMVLPTRGQLGKEAVLQQIIRGIREITNKINRARLLGLGIGTPGLVDSKHGIVYNLTNIPGWKNVPLKKILEREFKLPALVDNDVNLMTLGEWAVGQAKGAENVVCLTLGTGVGGGLIIEGKLYRGSSLSAGEIGHIPINFKGPRCNCGNIGCLERYIGNRYMVERARAYLKKERRTVINKWLKEGKNLTPELLAKGARIKDRFCLKIWEEMAEYLATALSGIVNFVNPDKIIIGGGMAEAGAVLFKPLGQKVRDRAMSIPARKVKILKAGLGKKAGLVGAAMLVFLESR
jgi:glucokinase